MVFGDPQLFAVEALYGETHGKWILGRLRFWVRNLAVGDFDDTSDLATSARSAQIFLSQSERRKRADLDSASADDVFETLYGRYVQSVSDPLIKPWPGEWEREPFILDDVGEASLRDKFAVVAVRRGDGNDRVLVSDFKLVSETVVPAGYLDHLLAQYCSWVDTLVTTTRS